jgi:hypothetical protein
MNLEAIFSPDSCPEAENNKAQELYSPAFVF